MPFASSIFIGLFLPVSLLVQNLFRPYFIRFYFLLVLSFIFYWWAEPLYYVPMVLCVVSSYLCGLGIDKTSYRKFFLILGILFNFGQFFWIKYSHFFYLQIKQGLAFFNISFHSDFFIEHHLPLGVSFFTFHAFSYLIDVYRREIKSCSSFGFLSQYFLFFPHQIAGPIVRFKLFKPQAELLLANSAMKTEGTKRFLWGFVKKVLFADTFAIASDWVFGTPLSDLSTPLAWVGVLAYTFQIYFDFSGYSDMAIGLALFFGIRFDENFLHPYRSKSITEFWRRWHISLSTWFRDYLYIPLGGNRVSSSRTYFNLLVVFLICGAWHGANWTFIAWGLWHGVFLVLERRFPNFFGKGSVFFTFFLVMMGWVLFRSVNLEQALSLYKTLFVWKGNSEGAPFLKAVVFNSPNILIAFLLAPLLWVSSLESFFAKRSWVENSILFFMFVLGLSKVANETFSPFIYFRF